jgi:hypothetical protein
MDNMSDMSTRACAIVWTRGIYPFLPFPTTLPQELLTFVARTTRMSPHGGVNGYLPKWEPTGTQLRADGLLAQRTTMAIQQ